MIHFTVVRKRKRKGRFIKPCPCSPDSVSCGYLNINLTEGCPYRCSYCVLNVYLEDRSPVGFHNSADSAYELEDIVAQQRFPRLGSGELADSLAAGAGISGALLMVEYSSRFPNAVFELKTKSDHVQELLGLRHVPRNCVVSWSLNSPGIIRNEEIGTPGLSARLSAIKAVQEKGFLVGLHFDPLILTEGWQRMYDRLIIRVARSIRAERLAWISLGALRFPSRLRTHILKLGGSELFRGELVKTRGNKYRYFRPLRLELYDRVKRMIGSRISPEIPLYLCMETVDVWREILPQLSPERDRINEMLFQSVFR